MNELIVQKVYKIVSNGKIKPIGKSSDPKGAIVDLGSGIQFIFEPPTQYLEIKHSMLGKMKAGLVQGFNPGELKGFKTIFNNITVESPDGYTFIVKG